MRETLLGLLQPRSMRSDNICKDMTTYLSDSEGVVLNHVREIMFDGVTYRIRSDDGRTEIVVHSVKSDLCVSRFVIRNSTRAACSFVLDGLDRIAKQHRLKRIIVHDLQDESLCASLRAHGYVPGLGAEDYRKLVT